MLYRQAESILRTTLRRKGGSDDKWTAAQCLAYYGECDSFVVTELIKQLLEADDLMRHEQAATLLSTLSEGSVSAPVERDYFIGLSCIGEYTGVMLK